LQNQFGFFLYLFGYQLISELYCVIYCKNIPSGSMCWTWCVFMYCSLLLWQHSCVYVRRSGQFRANQAQVQLDELAKHRTPVCCPLLQLMMLCFQTVSQLMRHVQHIKNPSQYILMLCYREDLSQQTVWAWSLWWPNS